jgi:hypothetical protein
VSDNTAIRILLRKNQYYDHPESPVRVTQISPPKQYMEMDHGMAFFISATDFRANE